LTKEKVFYRRNHNVLAVIANQTLGKHYFALAYLSYSGSR
jgi:hypothetical protein